MAASTAAVTAGTTGASGGPTTGGWMGKLQEKMKAKKQAEMGGSGEVAPTGEAAGAVAPHGDEAHTGGGAEQQAIGPAAQPKKKGGMWGGIGQNITRAVGSLFYKMPAAGKYKNSPIEKNFGSKEHRGFGHNEPIANPKTGETPLDLKSFGVGSLPGGVNAKGRSKTGPGGKFNN